MENSPQPQIQPEQAINTKKSSCKDIIITVILSVVALGLIVVIILNTFVFFNVKVDGPSMEPTLYGGKVVNGKNDSSGDLLLGNKLKTATYGDIIVIENVVNNAWIIKRVIGLEGDVITIKNGKVYRKQIGAEEKLLEENYVKGKTYYNYSEEEVSFTVGVGEIFYLGDNRENSSDSRVYGCCTLNNVVGVIEPSSLNQNSLRVFFVNLIYGIFNGSCN